MEDTRVLRNETGQTNWSKLVVFQALTQIVKVDSDVAVEVSLNDLQQHWILGAGDESHGLFDHDGGRCGVTVRALPETVGLYLHAILI